MGEAGRTWAKGDNYEVVIEGAWAKIRVWRRPDLSFERGASLAEELSGLLGQLARGAVADVKGLAFDLRTAPPLIGKRTRAALANAAAACEISHVRLSLICSSSAQRALLEHVIGRHSLHCLVFADEEPAMAWLRSDGQAPRAG
jgi:hypothetical protein